MRVAILGNMNNNGFSIMRYFRDIGVDAHLILYSNDGVGKLNHFTTQNDSFNIDKWDKFIHKSKIHNGPNHVLPHTIQILLFPFINFIYKILGREIEIDTLSKDELHILFNPYDSIITSGYAPAILSRINRPVSIFFPYAMGIEGICRLYSPPLKSFFNRIIFEYARLKQLEGLRQCDFILNAELGVTKVELDKRKLKFRNLAIPMVYDKINLPKEIEDYDLAGIASELNACSFSVLMHSSLVWKEESCRKYRAHSKNNHWVIHGFSELVKARPYLRTKLIILEYGPDVENTKRLICELNIADHVMWLKKTSRNNIMWLLQRVTVACGEFIDIPKTFWGGTGWEVLASGKPLLQGFNFSDDEFEEHFGYPPPPLLIVNKESDIYFHFNDICDNPSLVKRIGEESQKWFKNYNGAAIAKKWLELIN